MINDFDRTNFHLKKVVKNKNTFISVFYCESKLRIKPGTKSFDFIIISYNLNSICTGRCRNLSVKEILDCQQATLGHGMISMNALSYIFAQGLTFESHYPSVHPRPTRCKYKQWHPRVRIRGYHLLEPFNEDNLKSAVALIGPVTANIKVTDDFFFYQSGVFYDQARGVLFMEFSWISDSFFEENLIVGSFMGLCSEKTIFVSWK